MLVQVSSHTSTLSSILEDRYNNYVPSCIILDCVGHGLMLYQTFPNLMNSHIASQYQEIVAIVVQNGSKKVETVS